LITIAMSSGRLLTEAVDLFANAGIDIKAVTKNSRKLIFDFKDLSLKILITRPTDVTSYLEYGAADCGIVGKDTLMESGSDLYEPLDLKIGKCRLVVAAPNGFNMENRSSLRIGTKYPKISSDFFVAKGINAEIVKLNGSIELAPLAGLSDVIVDLTATGETLKTNKLYEIETIAEITGRLVVNKVSLKVKSKEIRNLIQKLMKARKN